MLSNDNKFTYSLLFSQEHNKIQITKGWQLMLNTGDSPDESGENRDRRV